MVELTGLKRQRAANKGKLTLIINNLKKANVTSIEECKAKLNRVEKLMEEFTIIEGNIFQLNQDMDIDTEYEENYYKAITELNQTIRKLGLTTTNMNSSIEFPANTTPGGADIRLPKLNIPTFSGDYTEWQSFHDIIIEANYTEAIQKLRQRYDRKRYTMNPFIRTFIDQPSISQATSHNIKKLMDTSDEVLRGMKAMGPHGEDRDPWLIYLIVNKLDDESRSLWAKETADKDFPTMQNLFDFLLLRGDALESIRLPSKRGPAPFTKPTSVKTHVAVQGIQCSICQTEGHLIYQCPTLNEMEVDKRRELIKDQRRCFNCLSDTHPVFRCLSKRRCNKCMGRHHTLVHSEEFQNLSTKKDELTKKVEEAGVSSLFGSSGAQHILPTAVVEIFSALGQTIRCRALLDSGSQVSFISESCLQRLGLSRQNGRMSIKGLGQVEAGTTKGMVHLSIKPPSGNNLAVKAFVLRRITKLPNVNIQDFQFPNFEHLQLADPEYYRANEVEVLIGVDLFFDILLVGELKRHHDNLVLQNTIFGWVVAGTINSIQTKDDAKWCGTTNIEEYNIDETLKRFWELEQIPNDAPILKPVEELCEQRFKTTYHRCDDGR